MTNNKQSWFNLPIVIYCAYSYWPFVTYLLLEEHVDSKLLQEKIDNKVTEYAAMNIYPLFGVDNESAASNPRNYELFLTPLTQIQLNINNSGNRFCGLHQPPTGNGSRFWSNALLWSAQPDFPIRFLYLRRRYWQGNVDLAWCYCWENRVFLRLHLLAL